jgi:hypothetical protein
MSGVLRGGGETAHCTVSAIRVTLSGTRLFKNCHYSICWISKPLPEGNYQLSVDGETVDIHHSKGVWQATEI